MSAGFVLRPDALYSFLKQDAGGGEGGNASLVALVPGLYLNKRPSDRWFFGFGLAGTAGGGLD